MKWLTMSVAQLAQLVGGVLLGIATAAGLALVVLWITTGWLPW